MTMQLGELLEAVYRNIHDDVVDGVATGGSATTIIDTTRTTFPTNKFKNWVAFISRTTDGLTPQGKYSVISAWTTGGTATMDTVTDAVGAGDEYSFCKGTIPLYTLIKLCGDALRKLGRVEVDDISLTTLTDTRRYTMPIATKGNVIPRSIYLRDTDDYTRLSTPNYKILPAAGGSTETLEFTVNPSVGHTIVIKYMGLHPTLTAYNSYVNESIHPELAVAACVERAFWWKAMPKRRKIDMENWGQAKSLLQEAKQMYPIKMPIVENQRVPITLFN